MLRRPSLSACPAPQTPHSGRVATAEAKRHVDFFLDASNLMISAQRIAVDHGDGPADADRVRLHCRNLRAFVQRDRDWRSGYAAAALSQPAPGLVRRWGNAGINLEVSERGCFTGREQGVDQLIQCAMYELLDPSRVRGVVVLATGDGNGHAEGRGFLPALQMLHRDGFEIEVMSWRHSLNRALGEWAHAHGRVIELDDWYRHLTFVEKGRAAQPLTRFGDV